MPEDGCYSASVRLQPPPPEASRLNRRLFGKFTEHLGRNVYGGAWAQILQNPEFAGPPAWPDGPALLRRLEAAEGQFDLPGLPSSLADGRTPWWHAHGAVRCAQVERRGRPILSMHADAAGGGIRTPLFLPTHRISRYRLEVRMRSAVPVQARLLLGGRDVWASAAFGPTSEFVTRAATLEGPAAPPPPGTPFHLEVAPEEPGRVELRRCLLFPDDHLGGWDPDVVGFLRAARLPLLRFPGGNFVSAYHWGDGIGPTEDRPVLPNPAWPEAEWNHVGTDEWLDLCAILGCEPLICVNAGTGTPAEAADWVEYCNGAPTTPFGALRALNGHPHPYGVRLWEVGNELYGDWQAGATDAAGYAARYTDFARAMRARDPEIRLIANGDTEDWNRTVVRRSDEPVRVLSHHALYGGWPEGADPRRTYLEHVAFPVAYRRQWESLTEPLRAAGRPPRLAITELQMFTHRPTLPTNATMAEAVWDACILHEAMRAGDMMELVTHSALVNHGGGLRKEREVVYAQPAWWVTHLYGSAPDPLEHCPAEVESPRFNPEPPYRLLTAMDVSWLDAVVLRSPDGQIIVVFLVNRHPEATCVVRLDLAGAVGDADIETLSGASYMAINTWDRPDAVCPRHAHGPWPAGPGHLTVPPAGIVRFVLALRGA